MWITCISESSCVCKVFMNRRERILKMSRLLQFRFQIKYIFDCKLRDICYSRVFIRMSRFIEHLDSRVESLPRHQIEIVPQIDDPFEYEA